MATQSSLELIFTQALTAHAPDLPQPETQYKFHPARRWRADFAWPEERVLIEIEGIYGAKSRHRTAIGYHNDCIKYNAAAALGFTVLRYTSRHINGASADPAGVVAQIKAVLATRRSYSDQNAECECTESES